MNESFHGHEVMRMIVSAPEPYSRKQLSDAVETQFGQNPRFHTCSAQSMTLDELLQFLSERGKLTEVNGILNVSREDICEHE